MSNYKPLDDRQVLNRAALSTSVGSSANATLDTILGLIDSKMVTLTGTQTLTNKTINGANNTLTVRLNTSDVTNVLPIANGGTDNGSLPVTAGGVLYTNGTNVQNTGAGTAGQVLTSTGSAAPIWSAGGGVAPIGGIISAFLTLTQFQNQMGTGWILADGSAVSGSAYEAIVGQSTVHLALATPTSTATGVTVIFSTAVVGTTGTTTNTSNQLVITPVSGVASGQLVNMTDVPSGTTVTSANVYTFTVTSANATAGAVYTNNTQSFTVTSTIVAGTTLVTTGTGTPNSSGTLTLSSGTGDPTITFSAVTQTVTMSASATGSATNTVNFSTFDASTTVNTTMSSSVLTNVASTVGIAGGQLVSAPNIPANSSVSFVTVTTVPDARGLVLRGKNNGRSDGDQDPAGDLPLGTYEADETAVNGMSIVDGTHYHQVAAETGAGGSNYPSAVTGGQAWNSQGINADTYGVSTTDSKSSNTSLTSSNPETRVKAIVINHFIRIN